MSDFRIPQNPGIGGLDELTTDEELVVQQIASGSYFVWNETPTGTINGTNTDFTITNTPNPTNSLRVYVNGQRMQVGAGNDYTLSGTTITFSFAPPGGSVILVDYTVDPS